MDFFKNVSARVGDVAKNVGDLLLDSDSNSEADERSERTRRAGGGDDAGGGEGSGPGGPARSRAGGTAVAEGSGSDSERGEEDDGPLIPENVWNSLRAAKDRVARAAKSTAASVARDVVAAAETVRRDLGELGDSEQPSGASVVFVGDAASEYAAGGAGGLGVSVETDDEDGGDGGDEKSRREELGFGSDGDGALDPDVVETFERTAEALENVGEKVEKFGAAVFQNAGRIFDKIVDTFDDDDDDDDGGGARAKPPGSFVSPGTSSSSTRRPSFRDTKKGTRRDSDGTSVPASSVPAMMTAEHLFDKKVAAMQRDSSTYCDEPADAAAYAAFAATFDAESDDTKNAVEALLAANSFMKVMSGRIVPAVVAYDVFWSRYFFRLRLLERERDAETEAVSEREKKAVSQATIGSESGDAPRARASPGTPEGASSSKQAGETREDENLSRSPRRNDTMNPYETSRETSRERVVVSGGDGDLGDSVNASAPGHRRVVSLATDDGTVASDDSLGRDWTRVRDVESPTGLGEASADADAESDARRADAEASGEEKMDEPEPEPEPEEAPERRSSVPAEPSAAAARPPPRAPTGAGDDSDLDEDWGMDSD